MAKFEFANLTREATGSGYRNVYAILPNGIRPFPGDRSDALELAANELGQDGWDLVTAYHHPGPGPQETFAVLWMRRTVEN
jgi:hypothetical protein